MRHAYFVILIKTYYITFWVVGGVYTELRLSRLVLGTREPASTAGVAREMFGL